MNSNGADYVDSVGYPTDNYIHPGIIDAREAENDYDDIVKYIAKTSRMVNGVILQKLQEAHSMEIATLLEYITQQNAVTTQVILDEYLAKNHK